jgi:hypothetical protein
MAYTPNPDREVKDGKAMVSAKELADFKSQYGEDKTLRDLLNADKGLRRKGEDSAPMKSSKSSSDEDMSPTKANAVKINGASTDSARSSDSLKTTSLASRPAPTPKPDYGNEGNRTKPTPKVSTDYTPGKVPTSEQAAANRAAAAETVKSAAGAVGDYFRNFETPAERRSRESKQGSGMKKGGAVSASRRADGIAQRGKTRGKMC